MIISPLQHFFYKATHTDNPVINRKATFIILFVLIASSLSLVMGSYNLISKPINANTLILLSNILSGLGILIYIYKTGKIFIPSQIICLAVYLASVSGGYHTGGIYSLDLQPLLHVPVTAFILHNGKSALRWFIISLVTFGVFYYVEFYTDLHLKSGLENMSHITYYVKRGMFVVYIAAMLIFYENTANNLTQKLFNRTLEVNRLKNEIETQYKLVLDNIDESVFLLNKTGDIIYCNSSIQKYVTEIKNDLIGKNFFQIFDINFELDTTGLTQKKFEFVTQQKWIFEAKWHPIKNQNNADTYLLLLQNITEEYETEKQIEAIRQKIARDFHDEMGNKLASISLRSNLLNEMTEINASEKLKINLLSIKNNANTVYQSFRDFIWAIDHQSDMLTEVMNYLKDFGEEYIQHYPIDFNTNIEATEAIKLPLYWSRQIVFIFKEAMTNAVKHSNCSQIEFGMRLNTDKEINIWLKDNGNGFKLENIKHKRGILHLTKRAQEINCNVIIESNDLGTAIYFIGKL